MAYLSRAQLPPSSYDGYSKVKRFIHEDGIYRQALFATSSTLLGLGVLANLLVCIVVLKCRMTRQTTKLSTFFILHLSIADLVFRAVGSYAQFIKKQTRVTPLHCKAIVFAKYSCAAATFTLLSAIAVDRYIHILFPLRSLQMKQRRLLSIALIWLYAVSVGVGFIVSATSVNIYHTFKVHKQPNSRLHLSSLNTTRNRTRGMTVHYSRSSCSPGYSGSLERKVAFTIYFVFAFIIPFVLMMFSYTRITLFLWRKQKAMGFNNGITRAKLKAIRMLITVGCAFLVSWAPIMILDMCVSYPSENGKAKIGRFHVRPLLDCVSKTSSILNPIIYAFENPNFRNRVSLLFLPRRKCSKKICALYRSMFITGRKSSIS